MPRPKFAFAATPPPRPLPDSGPDTPPDSPPDSPPDCPPHSPALPAALAARRVRVADADRILACVAGTDDPRVQDWLVDDATFALDLPVGIAGDESGDRACAALAAMGAIQPRDIVGGMLAAQMVAVHSAALGCLRRAAAVPASGSGSGSDAGAGSGSAGLRPADPPRDAELRHAARLLRVFDRQLRVRDDSGNPHVADSLSGRNVTGSHRGRPMAHVVPQRDPAAGSAGDVD